MRQFVCPAALMFLALCFSPAAAQQYKRVHQNALDKITAGKSQAAIEDLQKFAAKSPQDAETHYMLAVAHAAAGDLDAAAASLQKAIELGLPPGRFLGGSKTGLEPLKARPEYQELRKRFGNQLAHGPMLGQVSGKGVAIWVRTADEAPVRVTVSRTKDLQNPVATASGQTKAADDFTTVLSVGGLMPNTEYYYGVSVGEGSQPRNTHSFHTLAEAHQPIKFRLAFGGGAGFVPKHERMWTTIAAKKPDVLLLLGDNVYIDAPQSPEMQHYTYYRRQSRPEFRALVASVPTYSIWDDHDFGTNDCSGGPEIDKPAWKLPVWKVYRNNWVNPGYGGGEAHPGCYYDFYLGDVHCIMLDGRYYRTRKAQPSTMLGPVQKKWLMDTVKNSRGKIKVLCSPVPWTFLAKGKSPDTWNGFQEERNEIFRFLADNDVTGVVLMSADRHRSDLWKIDREKGYPLYEFNSSRLTNQHVHGEMKAAEFSYNDKQSFGLVDIDTTVDDPTVTYRIGNIDGEEVFKFELKGSQLK